jgi:hypothetical protein
MGTTFVDLISQIILFGRIENMAHFKYLGTIVTNIFFRRKLRGD